jgi:hypothetical protein
MKYFDFYKLENMWDIIEPFLVVVVIYAIIFSSAWVYNRLGR